MSFIILEINVDIVIHKTYQIKKKRRRSQTNKSKTNCERAMSKTKYDEKTDSLQNTILVNYSINNTNPLKIRIDLTLERLGKSRSTCGLRHIAKVSTHSVINMVISYDFLKPYFCKFITVHNCPFWKVYLFIHVITWSN